MDFSLIICTYNRVEAIQSLMQSIQKQTLYPNQIIVVDGSTNKLTEALFQKKSFDFLEYYFVNQEFRGLTKQRNFGIEKVNSNIAFVCFLDDDVVLENDYFEKIRQTYIDYPNALGIGGYITNDAVWEKQIDGVNSFSLFCYDGFCVKESSRFKMRKFLGLDSNVPPGFMPLYSHGRSLSFLPPTGKVYPVEQLMGGVASFKKEVLDQNKFSTFFEGYGLYEDADFSVRISKKGQLYLNTNAKLAHYHHPDGRPNQYKYGKMVVKNGWYVWRVKNPSPKFIHIIKWHFITLLLILIRVTNIVHSKNRTQALTEVCGRVVAYFQLFFSKPKIQYS